MYTFDVDYRTWSRLDNMLGGTVTSLYENAGFSVGLDLFIVGRVKINDDVFVPVKLDQLTGAWRRLAFDMPAQNFRYPAGTLVPEDFMTC